MKLFGEKVNNSFTNSTYNILCVEDFSEIFFDVYEVKLNNGKFPLEKVSEYKGNPVVSVPIIVNEQEYMYPFVLSRGKQNIIFHEKNTEIPVDDFIPEIITEEVKDEQLQESKQEILEQIDRAKREAIAVASKIKKQKLIEANQEIRTKQKALGSMITDARASLVNEFLSVSKKIKKEFIDENDNRFSEIRETIDNKIQDMSDSLWESLKSDFSTSEKQFDSKIKELIKGLYESLQPKIDNELKTIATEIVEKVDSIEKTLDEKLKDKADKVLIENVEGELNSIATANIELNDKINKGVNKALSRVGNIDKKVDELTIALSEEVNTRIDEAESYITNYYKEKLELLEGKTFDLNEKTRKYFIELITESRNNLIDEVRTIKDEKPIEYIVESKGKKETINSDKLIKDFDTKINSKIDTEVTRLRKYIAVYSGGGSVAMQFAAGGTMNGNLTVVGTISASQYLGLPNSGGGTGGSDVSSLSSNWQNTYTTVQANSATNWNYQGTDLKALSANWQNTYTTVQANSAAWAIDNGDDVLASTKVRSSSANWDSTYTTVQANSAAWSNNLPLSGGSLTGPLSTKSIIIDPSYNITGFQEGRLYYDNNWKTVTAQIESDVNMQIGQEDLNYVYNDSDSDIYDGQAVYVTGSGSDGVNVVTDTVALAKADNIATSNVTGVATCHIPIGTYGYVTSRGKINNFDTTGFGNSGNLLYLSPTVAGGLTSTIPPSPNIKIIVGRLLISDSLSGRISVTPEKVPDPTASIAVSVASQIFLIPTISVTNNLYRQLSYTNTGTLSARSVTVDATPPEDNNILADQFLYDTGVGVTQIPSGVWEFTVPAYVSNIGNITRLKVEVYVYHTNGSSTLLFEQWSGSIEDTLIADQSFSYAAPAYNVLATDKLMVRLYGTTTRTAPTTIHYVLGDGNGAYMTTPLKLRHILLSNFNEDPEVQHLNSTQLEIVNSTPVNLSTKANLSGDNIFNGNQTIIGSISASQYLGIPSGDDVLASTKVRSSSANWDSTYTTVLNNSALWIVDNGDDVLASTKVRSSSANWDNAYTTVLNNSATNWNYQGTDLKALSSNWQNTYTTVQANSATWAIDNGDDLEVSTKVRSSSANWDSTYTTVQANSATWAIDNGDDVLASTKVRSSSANWDNAFTNTITLSTNKANLSGGNTFVGNQTIQGTLSTSSTIIGSNLVYNNGNTNANNITIGTNDNYNLSLETSGINRMVILSSGNIGIGTSLPNQSLTVVGNISSTGMGTLSALRVTGNVGIGQAPTSNSLDVNGTLNVIGNATFPSTTRPTSGGTGTPASTSLITRSDFDIRAQIWRYPFGAPATTTAGTASSVVSDGGNILKSGATSSSTSLVRPWGSGQAPFSSAGGGFAKWAGNKTIVISFPLNVITSVSTGITRIQAGRGYTATTVQDLLSNEYAASIKIENLNIKLQVANGSTLSTSASSLYTLTVDTYVDVMISISSGTATLYINGNSVGSLAGAPTTSITVGGGPGFSASLTNGATSSDYQVLVGHTKILVY